MTEKYHSWLKAFSGLCINISAAWFAVPFIGYTISFPKDLRNIFTLTLDIAFGIIFLLITVLCEKKLEKK